jgi:hypothetical protein
MVNLNNLSKNNSSISSLVKQVIEEVNGELKEKAVREFIKESKINFFIFKTCIKLSECRIY